MLTKLQTFSLTSSLCIKYVWPDIHPDLYLSFLNWNWSSYQPFGHLAWLEEPWYTIHFLPASLSKRKTHFSLQLLAANKSQATTSCQSWHSLLLVPHPHRARVCTRLAQVKDVRDLQLCSLCCELSVFKNETWSQERALAIVPLISSSDYGASQRSCHIGILWGIWVMNVLLKEAQVNNC